MEGLFKTGPTPYSFEYFCILLHTFSNVSIVSVMCTNYWKAGKVVTQASSFELEAWTVVPGHCTGKGKPLGIFPRI